MKVYVTVTELPTKTDGVTNVYLTINEGGTIKGIQMDRKQMLHLSTVLADAYYGERLGKKVLL